MFPNNMKHKLKQGSPAFGLSIMIPSPQLVEIAAKMGFDWVLIDCEHGTINPETVETLAMAAQANGITPIARPRTKNAADIQQVMDRGVMGVQVPHVNTADDAQAVVDAVKYYPIGKRGLAAGTRPANYGFGISQSEYVEEANRHSLVCVQFEDKEAIENADEILKVENIDVFFIGPSDLSQSMGHPGQYDEPSVAHAIDSTFEKILGAGQIAGTPGNADKIRSVLDKGVLYTYTHATKLLGSASEAFFAATKGK
jgi:2-keto-3-deoxy-L-rhamnonate aldolase RhmA